MSMVREAVAEANVFAKEMEGKMRDFKDDFRKKFDGLDVDFEIEVHHVNAIPDNVVVHNFKATPKIW